MQLHTIFLALFLGAIRLVSGGGLSGGYERVWIFYAYQIDFYNNPRSIGANCNGASGGPCTFTELMEVVEGVPKGTFTNDPDSEYLPDDPNNNVPDPDATARYIFKRGWTDDIYGKNFLRSRQNAYNKMLQDVAFAIGSARNTWSPEAVLSYQGFFDRAYYALSQARDARYQEWCSEFRPAIKAALPSITIKQVDGFFGKYLDFMGAKDLEENEGIADVDKKIAAYTAIYNKDNKNGRTHHHVILTMDGCKSTSHESCRAYVVPEAATK